MSNEYRVEAIFWLLECLEFGFRAKRYCVIFYLEKSNRQKFSESNDFILRVFVGKKVVSVSAN
ncbi:hypothetical protein FOL54_03800 [Bartonella quintana]|nr:hypothetical protein FOL54_03800 [Bartonella quintana]